MATADRIVRAHQDAIGRGDFVAARRLLHDDLSFRGPFDVFAAPEPYLESLKKLHPIVQRIETKKVWSDGPDVCVFYETATTVSIAPEMIAEWFRVRGDRIASIRAVFDARPFAAMFAEGA